MYEQRRYFHESFRRHGGRHSGFRRMKRQDFHEPFTHHIDQMGPEHRTHMLACNSRFCRALSTLY